MASLTEIALFKACVETPQYIKSFSDLNLDRISGPSNTDDLTEEEVYKKRLNKLFHMAWSGITKYIRTVTQLKQKPIEFPALGILMPVGTAVQKLDGESQRLNSRALHKLDPTDIEVQLWVHQSFVNATGVNVACVDQDSLVQVYDPSQGHFIPNTHHINSSSVANVCDTDVFTIELIIKEIGAQMIH